MLIVQIFLICTYVIRTPYRKFSKIWHITPQNCPLNTESKFRPVFTVSVAMPSSPHGVVFPPLKSHEGLMSKRPPVQAGFSIYKFRSLPCAFLSRRHLQFLAPSAAAMAPCPYRAVFHPVKSGVACNE
jgi:hypothetical protein